MPRTKLPRNPKRNREAADEDSSATRLREFDAIVDQFLCSFELKYQHDMDKLTSEIRMQKNKLPAKLLKMKLGDLHALNLKTIKEFNEATKEKQNESHILGSTLLQSARKKSKDDEGYLTEDNNSVANSTQSTLPKPTRAGRTPMIGPLSSAKARRRSRSVCGYLPSVVKQVTTTDRISRSKMRTPMESRIKAASADRATPVTPKVTPNTPLSLLRYPKAGETVISLSGSPVVAQGVQDPIANVNIPIRNGVISLRPTKMQSIDPDILTRIDADTLNQIKQLQSNLNIIMRYADKTS